MSRAVLVLRAITKTIQKASGLLALTLFGLQVSGGAVIAQSVIISEFMANPVVITDSTGEWVELRNITDSPQDITGWVVDTGSGHTLDASNLTAGSSLTVPAQGYFLICRNIAAASSCDYVWSGMSLNNTTDDSISLEDTVNGTSDNVEYNGSDEVNAGESTIVTRDENNEPEFEHDDVNDYDGDNTGTPDGINYDVTAPDITVDTPEANEVVAGSFSISGTAHDGGNGLLGLDLEIEDEDGLVVYSDYLSLSGFNAPFSFSGISLPEGNYTARFTAYDQSENEGDHTIEFSVDTTAPVVGVNRKITNDHTPSLSGTVDDLTAMVTVTVKGKSYLAKNNGDGTWTLNDNKVNWLADNTYDVIAEAIDQSGNSGVDETVDELIIDSTAPVVTVDVLSCPSHNPILRGTVDDPTAKIVITVNGQNYKAINNGDGTWTVKSDSLYLPVGVYDIIATATDPYGNVGTDKTTNELTITTQFNELEFGTVVSGNVTNGDAEMLDTDGDGIPDSEDDTPNGEDEQEASENDEVASDEDDSESDLRWVILTGAIVAFLWFLLRQRDEQDA